MKEIISGRKFLLVLIIIVTFATATGLLITQFASASSIAKTSIPNFVNSSTINNNATLLAQKDSYIIGSAHNINQGASQILKVQQLRQMRTLLSFDLSPYENVHVSNAKLRIFAQINDFNWGNGESIEIHRLTTNWTEGNGVNAYAGTGLGVTWSCATDSIIENTISDCNSQWNGGSFVTAPTDIKQIKNNTVGVWLEFNVTNDVNFFLDGNTTNNFGWIIKKTNEQTNGNIAFASRESISNQPQLVLTLSPPTGLLATAITQTTFTANWQPVTGATAYDITMVQLSNSKIMTQKNITSTSAVIQGLTPGTQYSWSITAKNALLNSTSSVANTWTISAPPVGITIQPTGPTITNVSWNASAGATNYHITLTPSGKTATVIYVPATSYSLTNLTSGTKYSFTLNSGNPSGYSVQSAPMNFTTLTPLSPPTGLLATAITQTTFTANWQPVTGATAYDITMVQLSNSKIMTQKNITSTSAVIQGLTPGTQYSWSITAKNALLNSTSSVAYTWTISAPPVGITIQPTGPTITNVSWNASAGATNYHITLTPSGKTATVIYVPATSYSLTNLTSGTKYSFTLNSGNPSGYSVQSAPMNFTTPTPLYNGSIGVITFAFGHAFSSESLGIDNMTKYHFVGNISPVESKIDQPGWFNQTQLLSYKKAGWEILGHSITHPVINNTTPNSVLQDEIVQGKQDLTNMGFCISGYESPFDIITTNSSVFIKNNYKYAVIDPNQQNTVYSITHDGAKWNFPIAIHYYGMGKGILIYNFVGTKAVIDYAIANHTYLILNFHQIDSSTDPYTTYPSVFWQILQYVKQKSDAGQIKVMNSAQALGIQCP